MSRTPGRPRPDAPAQDDEGSYIQALYITFWKPIFLLVGLAHIIVACWILKLIWPEPVGYAFAVAMLLAAPVAYLNLALFARKMGWDEGPILDFRLRSTILLIVGYCLALGLATVLAVNESNDRERGRIAQEQRDREQEEWKRKLSDPDVRRANEVLRRRQGN